MSQQELQPARPRRRSRLAAGLIALTAAACAAALLFRLPLCGRYWAWRLARAASPAESAAYLDALCNAGDASRWGVRALLADERPNVRQYGVLVLHHAKTAWARERLLDLLADSDASVQELAALGLAVRGDDAVIPTLKWQYETGSPATAAGACRAFEHLASPDALTAMYELAVQPADVERRAALVDTLAAIGLPECVPALLELLADDRPCASAARTAAPPVEIADRLRAAGYNVVTPTAPATYPRPTTIGERAAVALAGITAIDVSYSSDGPAEERTALLVRVRHRHSHEQRAQRERQDPGPIGGVVGVVQVAVDGRADPCPVDRHEHDHRSP